MSQTSYTRFRLANHGGWLGREPRSAGASADRTMDRFRSWALQVGDHDRRGAAAKHATARYSHHRERLPAPRASSGLPLTTLEQAKRP